MVRRTARRLPRHVSEVKHLVRRLALVVVIAAGTACGTFPTESTGPVLRSDGTAEDTAASVRDTTRIAPTGGGYIDPNI